MPSPSAWTSRRTACPTLMMRSVPMPSGSLRRNAASAIDSAAKRISCARRIMIANAQNMMIGTTMPTRMPNTCGIAMSWSIDRICQMPGL